MPDHGLKFLGDDGGLGVGTEDLLQLVGTFGVVEISGGDPDGASLGVHAVPDSASRGDLLLPLRQEHAVYSLRGERTF